MLFRSRCPGAAFAQQEALVLLVALLRQYRLEPAGAAEPQLVGRLTLRSTTGAKVAIRPRQWPDRGGAVATPGTS